MLDVIHYLLDTDLASIRDEDHNKYISAIRTSLYKTMYDKEYKFAMDSSGSARTYSGDYAANGGSTNEIKPYIPPTQFNPDSPNPFQGALREAPLG